MKVLFPNPHHSIVNVANSLLKYFGCETYHETLPVLDSYLEKGYQNIVLLLYDGMGSNLLRKNLKEDGFFRTHEVDTIHAAFPPTTVSSTTSLYSGKYPKEHGWLGWDLYFKEEDKTVTMFFNTLKDSEEVVPGEPLATKYYAYQSIFESIQKKHNTFEFYSFKGDYHNLKERNEKILECTKLPGKKLIYCYDTEPDYTMHEVGTMDPAVIEKMEEQEKMTEELCNEIKDALVIVLADHGHVDGEAITLRDYPDLFRLLRQETSIESRTCSFYVEEGKELEFEKLFQKYFEPYFNLYTKKEVIDNNFFGLGREHPHFQECLGDFLAIAVSNKYFRYDEKSPIFRSVHAGITEDEVLIPLIIYEKKNLD